jgi:hypothetical protein
VRFAVNATTRHLLRSTQQRCLICGVAALRWRSSDTRKIRSFGGAGDEIVTYVPSPLIGTPVSAWTPDTLIGIAVSHARDVLRKGVPMSHGDEFMKIDGTRVLYLSILLPMSDDGETISGLLGAANCRAVLEE